MPRTSTSGNSKFSPPSGIPAKGAGLWGPARNNPREAQPFTGAERPANTFDPEVRARKAARIARLQAQSEEVLDRVGKIAAEEENPFAATAAAKVFMDRVSAAATEFMSESGGVASGNEEAIVSLSSQQLRLLMEWAAEAKAKARDDG